jgi:hypothetical protein
MEKEKLPEIMEKLFPYQQEHVRKLLICIGICRVILDASDPGTGKTATTCALCAILGYSIFVICPKLVIPAWFQFANLFGVNVTGISNYEMIKIGKHYTTEN